MYILPVLSLLVSSVGLSSAQYTVYQPHQQVIFGGNSNSSIQGLTTASVAYDPTVLHAPAPPNPPIPTNQFIQLYSGGMNDMSMPLSGAFFGFSIEMSIATRVRMYLPVLPSPILSADFWFVSGVGKNSSLLQVPFLNLMANIKERVGWVQVRVGGNTQESAELVQSLPNGATLAKDLLNAFNPTGTPPLAYSPDLLYLMGNISSLTNTRWYLG
jgi:hypothetical protein